MSLPEELIAPLLDDARRLADSGFASPADIDTAMRLGAGHPRGPFAVMGVPPPEHPAAPGDATPPARAAVLGTGTMATGIAEVLARTGVPTVLVGRTSARAQDATQRIAARLRRAVDRGRLAEDQAAETLARLQPAGELDAAGDAEFVIEAVAEQLELKRAMLAEVARAIPHAALATNTSSFTVSEVAALVPDRERVLALHFFNPAPAMRLVEVVGGASTDPALLERGHGWARALGKTTVSCADAHGFLVNRLLIPYLNRAAGTCAAAGVEPAAADAMVREELGHPMGPFELMDLIGLDVMVFALQTLARGLQEPAYAPDPALRTLVAAGRLGRKTGVGFLEYATAA